VEINDELSLSCSSIQAGLISLCLFLNVHLKRKSRPTNQKMPIGLRAQLWHGTQYFGMPRRGPAPQSERQTVATEGEQRLFLTNGERLLLEGKWRTAADL
jgi:hypothetical protein